MIRNNSKPTPTTIENDNETKYQIVAKILSLLICVFDTIKLIIDITIIGKKNKKIILEQSYHHKYRC